MASRYAGVHGLSLPPGTTEWCVSFVVVDDEMGPVNALTHSAHAKRHTFRFRLGFSATKAYRAGWNNAMRRGASTPGSAAGRRATLSELTLHRGAAARPLFLSFLRVVTILGPLQAPGKAQRRPNRARALCRVAEVIQRTAREQRGSFSFAFVRTCGHARCIPACTRLVTRFPRSALESWWVLLAPLIPGRSGCGTGRLCAHGADFPSHVLSGGHRRGRRRCQPLRPNRPVASVACRANFSA
jgi:hypothetical protein